MTHSDEVIGAYAFNYRKGTGSNLPIVYSLSPVYLSRKLTCDGSHARYTMNDCRWVGHYAPIRWILHMVAISCGW